MRNVPPRLRPPHSSHDSSPLPSSRFPKSAIHLAAGLCKDQARLARSAPQTGDSPQIWGYEIAAQHSRTLGLATIAPDAPRHAETYTVVVLRTRRPTSLYNNVQHYTDARSVHANATHAHAQSTVSLGSCRRCQAETLMRAPYTLATSRYNPGTIDRNT